MSFALGVRRGIMPFGVDMPQLAQLIMIHNYASSRCVLLLSFPPHYARKTLRQFPWKPNCRCGNYKIGKARTSNLTRTGISSSLLDLAGSIAPARAVLRLRMSAHIPCLPTGMRVTRLCLVSLVQSQRDKV